MDPDVKRRLDALMKKINEDYKPEGAVKDVIAWGPDVDPIRYIPTSSPSLNYALGSGGWPAGRLIELYGTEGAGKTTLMISGFLDFLRVHPDKLVAVIDVEHRFNEEWAFSLGLPPEKFVPSYPPNAEDAADIMRDMMRSGLFCCIGFDSIGGAQPSDMYNAFEEAKTRPGGAAQVMGRTVRMNAADGDLFGCTVFYVNQMRDSMSSAPGAKFMDVTPGGRAVKHGVSLRIKVRAAQPRWTVKGIGHDGKPANIDVGFTMVFKVVKNTYGPSPREASSGFYFTPSEYFQGAPGFDPDPDWFNLALALDVVERGGGGNYRWGDVQGKGRIAFFSKIKEAGLMEKLTDEVVSRFGVGPESALGEDVEVEDSGAATE